MIDFVLVLGFAILFLFGCYLMARFAIFTAEAICEATEEHVKRTYERDKKKRAVKK